MSKSIIVALDEYKQTKFEQVLDQLDEFALIPSVKLALEQYEAELV